MLLVFALISFLGSIVQKCAAQGAGAYDLGDHREGQLSGQISPLNVFAIVLGCLAALGAVCVTAVCAYFTWVRYAETGREDYLEYTRTPPRKPHQLI